MDKEAELAKIDRQINKFNILGVPGTLLLGLGLYGIFAADGNAFHPALNNSTIVYNMLIFGIAIEAWQLYKLMPLYKRRARLSKQDSS